MTAATRKSPAPSNTVGPIISDTYAEDVNTEIIDLSTKEVCFIDNVGGTVNAITGNARNAPLAAYGKGNNWLIIPAGSNTGPTTINIDGVGLRNVLTAQGNALSGGELNPNNISMMSDDGASLRILFSAGAQATSAFRAPDCIFQDQKAQNTAGGSYTSGTSLKRTLNTSVRNVIAGAALTVGQDGFTLPAGTYWVEWETTFIQNSAQAWLQNETDASTPPGARTPGQVGGNNASGLLKGSAYIATAAAKTFAIRFQAISSVVTNGLGAATNLGTEVYTSVRIWQVGGGTSGFTDTVQWAVSSGADQNDLGVSQIAGYLTAKQIEITATAAFNLNGLSGGVDQRSERIINSASSTQAVTIKQQAAGSAAANRIASADFVLNPGEGVLYVYSANTSRWYREH